MQKIVLLTIGGVLLAELIVGMIVVFSGSIDTSASTPEGSFNVWLFSAVRDRSIESRAKAVAAPDLNDSGLVAEGFEHYNEMCVSCHGAPGSEVSELAMGLNPPAPVLFEASHRMTPEEQFVVIRDGIRMTGMPAWGTTHSDSAIWGIVALLQRLPAMTAEGYRALATKDDEGGEAKPAENEEDHSHHHH